MFFSLFIDFYKYIVSVISFRWQIVQIKSIKTSLNLLYYVEGWSEFVGPIFSSLRPGITVPSKKMLQRWRTVHKTMPNLTDQRFEPQTSLSRDQNVIATW